MKSVNFLLLLLVPVILQAQSAQRSLPHFNSENLAELEIGWRVKNTLDKESPSPKTVGKFRYSAQQVGTAWNFLKWMQKDYTPKGYLGESKWYLNEVYAETEKDPNKLDANSVEKSSLNALPQTYGAWTRFYSFLKYNDQQKIVPENNLGRAWHIAANEIRMISQPVIFISDSSQYYFTMPQYFKGIKGELNAEWNAEAEEFRNFRNHPALSVYTHYFIPNKVLDGEGWYVVIMTKDHQPLPFEKVTIGECLTLVEERLGFWYKVRLRPDRPGEREKYEKGYFEKRLSSAKAFVAQLKIKYKDRWNEIAELAANQNGMSIDFTTLANEVDIPFGKNGVDRNGNSTYPVLEVKPAAMEACRTGGPQWIVFRWKSHTQHEPRFVGLMDHLLNEFNYQYVYDYYFGKEKVIKPYTTLAGNSISTGTNHTPGKNVQPLVLSETAKAAAANKNTLFFDDFSLTPVNGAPANWAGLRNNKGEKAKVHQLNGVAGKWLRLQRYIYPSNLPMPLQGDFSLSFDVMVEKGGTVYASKGFEIGLYVTDPPEPSSGSTYNTQYITVRAVSGDGNRSKAPGYFYLGNKMPEGYFTCKKESYYYLPSFTGSEPVNKFTLTLRRKGETFSIWENNNKIYECQHAIPANLTFKNLRFNAYDEDSYYITNLRVGKE